MALLTTGLIKNIEVSGVRPSSTLSVRITNNGSDRASIQIRGFYLNGTIKTEYVLDVLILAPGEVSNSNFFAQFDAFEFRFIISSDAVEISTWGKDAAGILTVVYYLLPAASYPICSDGIAGATGLTIPSAVNQIYVANSSSNKVSVINGETNTLIGTVKVGSGPMGVSVNPATNRIYVTNQGSNNVAVIDGFSNVVIATIMVGVSPEGVDVNPTTNQIYVANHGSNNISVINGSTNTVIATVEIGS